MSIRTSGYFKKEEYDEIIPNSDFEKQSEGWEFLHFNDVTFDSGGAHCKMGLWDCRIYPKQSIEVRPEDLFLLGLSIKPEDCDNDEKFYVRIYPFDKFMNYRSTYHTDFEFRFTSSNLHTFYRLVSMSEIFTDFFDAQNSPRVIRAIVPFLDFDSDDWDENEAVCVKSFSMRRVRAEELRAVPVMLYKVYETSGMSLGTYFSDTFHTGIFNKAEYNFALTYIEETGGSNDLTLSLAIQSYDLAGNIWYDSVVFDDIVVNAGIAVQNKVYTKIATAGLGIRQRVKMVLSGGGTPGVVVLNVSATYKQ